MDDVADVKQAESGDAVEWGDQRCVAELGFGVVDGSLVKFDLRIEFINGGLLIVDLLERDGIGLGKIRVALKVELTILQMDLVMTQRRLRLIDLGLIGTWVDLGEQVALLDQL